MTTEPFTALELAYLASGARALAGLAGEDAARNDNPFVRELFEDEERVYRELVAKCERLAREPPRRSSSCRCFSNRPPQTIERPASRAVH